MSPAWGGMKLSQTMWSSMKSDACVVIYDGKRHKFVCIVETGPGNVDSVLKFRDFITLAGPFRMKVRRGSASSKLSTPTSKMLVSAGSLHDDRLRTRPE